MSAKKILALIAAPFLALSLSACSLNSNKGADNNGANGVPTQTQESEGAGPALPVSPSSETPSYEPVEPTQTQTYKTPDNDGFTTDDDDDSDGGFTTDGDTGGGYSAGKPSREEVKSGLKRLLESGGINDTFARYGATEAQIEEFHQCITDGVYNRVSDQTLRALASGDPNAKPSSQQDSATVGSMSQSCAKKLRDELSNNAG